jgi:small ligand-binding sensory domain FIST
MKLSAQSVMTEGRRSFETGLETGRRLSRELADPAKVVFTYLTVNHDQAAFLKGLREGVGPGASIVGCSGQGVMGRGAVREEGYAASVLGLGGDGVRIATASVEEIESDTAGKGRLCGERLRAGSSEPPKVVVLNYDPLSGIDAQVFLDALHAEVQCPIVGGASSHFFGREMTETFQYHDGRVLTRSAVACAFWGDFTATIASCIGCSPVGLEMTVTRAEGNYLFELDGRPALEVWEELTGVPAPGEVGNSSAIAIGMAIEGAGNPTEQLIRCALVLDRTQGGVLLGAAIPTGTRIFLHHRTVDDVLAGADRLVDELKARLGGKTLRAVLGFECGARTKPFLGDAMTNKENLDMQAALGPEAAWAGVVCWGEIYPVAGKPVYHNYTYPLLALAE